MKCTRAVESDSVKSARKAKDKLHKAFERVSGIDHCLVTLSCLPCAYLRKVHSRIPGQHTSIIACTAVPRVWHFSAFHYSK